jgi:LacI family transcriptional regulator
MNPIRCTLADIGKRIGLSISTVSLALRNNPRISRETRARVKKAAKSLKYRPDPLLSALVARKTPGRTTRTFANLGVIIDDRWSLQPHAGVWVDLVLAGMRGSCSRLGYALEVFYLEKDFGNLREPDRVLYARGIRGLIIPSFLEGAPKFKLDWDRYAIVALGGYPISHGFPRIGTDFFAGMGIVCSELAELGYERVGLAHSYQMESTHRFEWHGSLCKETQMKPKRLTPVPPHLPSVFSKDSFIRWIERHKPECVISNEPESLSYLKEAGLRVPKDIGFVSLSTTRFSEKITGLLTDYGLLGDLSIMQLHGLLLRGESGMSTQQQETLICQTWTERGTVRKMR